MEDLLTWSFWQIVLAGGIRLAAPIALAAVGEVVSERAGVLNLGQEGYMLAGALTGLYVASDTTWWIGIAAGAAAGAGLAALMVLLAVRGRGSQIVIGFGLTILGVGATGFVFHSTTPIGVDPIRVARLDRYGIPGLERVPEVGEIFFSHNATTWLAILLVPAVWLLLTRSTWGLQIRACGEDPDAAAARGIDVLRVRTIAVLFAGALSGIGGAAVTLGLVGLFTPNLTAGRGFIVIAVVIMASWNVWGAAGGALLFGLMEAMQLQLQSTLRGGLPSEALQALPFVVTLIVLIIGSQRHRMPRALGESYAPEY